MNDDAATLRQRLTSARSTPASAFLESAASCNCLVGDVRRETIQQFFCIWSSADETQAGQCENQFELPFQAFEAERSPKSQTTTALVHQKMAREINLGSTRLRNIRNWRTLPEAKMWENCRPSTGYQTDIPNYDFKIWLLYICQVPLFQPGARCPRPQCAAVLDTFGGQLLYCERGSEMEDVSLK